jgi:nucleotidyltransferase substrate binding protein (TIGR01987 family)
VLLLQEALADRPLFEYSKLEQEGIVQRFEYTFELAWKSLKDRLYYEGYDETSPRAVIRRSFEAKYLTEEETELWLESLEQRNLLSRTYDEAAAGEALALIKEKYFTVFERIYQRLKSEI